MGIGTMRAAKDVLVMFNGSSRARALEAALEKGVNHMFPVVRTCVGVNERGSGMTRVE